MLQKRQKSAGWSREFFFKIFAAFYERKFFLPFYSRHQEVKTSLDLSAVYETFYVASIDRFAVWISPACAMANWEKKKMRRKQLITAKL